MANLSKTRTVFAFTSPRTIEKIIPEIQVLIDSFDGQEWNKKIQRDFFIELSSKDFFEGRKANKNPDFAGRDRITRAPKALGFVDLKPRISLTDVGLELLSGKRTNEVIAKQLFKFQLPSPYHHNFPKDSSFNIRPYLELLRLVKELGDISKTEIAIFFVQMTDYEKFNVIVEDIKKFRLDRREHKGNRKVFTEEVFGKEILKIYSKEIETKKLKTREGGDGSLSKFIKTKKGNHKDYADAFMRYLRATQLITIDKKSGRMNISPSRIEEINFILKNIERTALPFKAEADYKKYLFNPMSVPLLNDDRTRLEKRLVKLGVKFNAKDSLNVLKDLLEDREKEIIYNTIKETEVSLKNYKAFDDIVEIFEKITKKDLFDPSLYFEWNVWRAFVMMNYAKDVRGNFALDLDGEPLNTALGNMPDIEVEYEDFKMIIEVTMSNGNKQYEMEGEPVARHFGKVQNASKVPVYCLFIAPKISEGALAHFFSLNRINTKAYGGKTRIIPMNLSQFVQFITIAKDKKFNDSKILKSYFDIIIQQNIALDDESIWFRQIHESIPSWIG